MFKAVDILHRYGLRTISCRTTGMMDVSCYGDTYTRWLDTGGRETQLSQVFTAKEAQAMLSSLPQMPQARHVIAQPGHPLYYNLDPYRTYSVQGVHLFYGRETLHIDYKQVERTLDISYNTFAIQGMIAGGIAHFIDPRVPWFERRLTYKKVRGWKFPHQPYCNVVRKRKADEPDYDDWDEGEYSDY